MNRYQITSTYIPLILGFGLVFMALISMLMGTVSRRGRAKNQEKKPKTFWLVIALYFLCGVFLIARVWFKTN